MSSISIDTSQLRAYAREIEGAADLLDSQVEAVVSKGALNIKNQMRADMEASLYFKGTSPAISYDMRSGGAFGGGFVEAEIGPVTGKPGSLANVAYFGTSRGGGTVADPQVALDAEEPKFTAALEALMAKVL